MPHRHSVHLPYTIKSFFLLQERVKTGLTAVTYRAAPECFRPSSTLLEKRCPHPMPDGK